MGADSYFGLTDWYRAPDVPANRLMPCRRRYRTGSH
jgi:hypothetical protein